MFIYTELIEESGIPPGLILACGLARKVSSRKKLTHLTEL